jgi:SSS family solute:Na+ symporter
MLHRGRFAKEGTPTLPTALRRFSWGSLLGINHEFTRGDKVISISLFSWKMFWVLVGVVVTLWNLKSRWPLEWWSNYWHITTVVVPLVLTVPTTIWFLWGGIHDLIQLFRDLESVRRNVLDDGTVVDHRNLDEVGEVAQSCSNHPAPPAVPPADGNNPRSAPR